MRRSVQELFDPCPSLATGFFMRAMVCAAAAVCGTTLSARSQVAADSVAYVQPDVVIHGSLQAADALRSAAFVSELDGTELRPLSPLPLDRALRHSGLVYVRDRGGRASVSTVGLRGFSASQTSVTLNGFSLANGQNGLTDLGLYPADILGQISIVRGSESAFSGSGAIGGTIRLITRDPLAQRLAVDGSLGSFGHRSASVTIPFGEFGVPLTLRTGLVAEDGDFGYPPAGGSPGSSANRTGNDARLQYALVESRIAAGASTLVSTMVYGVDSRRGSPGAVTLPVPADATLWDSMARAGVRVVTSGGGVLWEADLTGVYHTQRYEDRSAIAPVDDTYRNTAADVSVRMSVPLAGASRLSAGAEAGHSGITGDNVTVPGGRTQGALFVSGSFPVSQTGGTFFPSVRTDVFSDLTPLASWKAAFHMPLLGVETLTLRVGVGTSFRMPTFNERYWRPGGNPLLRHERAFMVEGGLSAVFRAAGEHRLLFIAHWSRLTDKIVGWPPENAERSRHIGSEVSWSWSPVPVLEVRSACALADVRSLDPGQAGYQFPFIPRWTASGGMVLRAGDAELTTGVEYASRRFTTIDNIAALSSDPYIVATVSAVVPLRAVGIPANASCFVDNVFDTSFEVVKGYPMPGRAFYVSLHLELE